MRDVRKIIMFMFAVTVCAIMLTIVAGIAYHGKAEPETRDILNNLIGLMIGSVITYVMLKENDNGKSL